MLFVFAGCGKSAKQKIIGKWAFEGDKDFIYNFTESGELVTTRKDMPEKKEKYRFIDNETLEVEMQGEKMKMKISFADNDNTINTENESKTKHKLIRQ